MVVWMILYQKYCTYVSFNFEIQEMNESVNDNYWS